VTNPNYPGIRDPNQSHLATRRTLRPVCNVCVATLRLVSAGATNA
jgi:hypothetical protein